ncbi:MAG: hypothetical protein KA116_11865 [Proteobacteria bacterium]|nr:hypothetical protein [Pseudomonadota bacterium]
MRTLPLIILIFISNIKAHENSSPTTQEFLKAFDRLHTAALNNVFQDNDTSKPSNEDQKAYLVFGSHRLNINKSGILKLTTHVLNLEKQQLELICKTSCPHCQCHNLKIKKSKWPSRLYNWALAPLSLVQDIFKDPIAFALAPSIRLTREYGALTFSTIVLSQITWEIIESMASFAIGAGGAHIYCVAFNIALMSIVKSASSSLGILTKTPYNDSILKRLIIALKNLAWGLRYTGSLTKNVLIERNGIFSIRKRKDHRKFNNYSSTISSQALEESGLFAAEVASVESINNSSNDLKSWSSDWNIIANTPNELEKWVLLKIHIQGLESIGVIARNTANVYRKEHTWSNFEFLKFHSQLGRWLAEVKNLNIQAVLELQNSNGIQSWAVINGLAEAERMLLLEIQKLMSVFRDENNRVTNLDFRENRSILSTIRKHSCEGLLF